MRRHAVPFGCVRLRATRSSGLIWRQGSRSAVEFLKVLPIDRSSGGRGGGCVDVGGVGVGIDGVCAGGASGVAITVGRSPPDVLHIFKMGLRKKFPVA